MDTTDDVKLRHGRTRENQQELKPIPSRLLDELRGRAKRRDAVAYVPEVAAVGPGIVVDWDHIPYPNSGNWIAVYRRGAPAWDITAWAYTNGQSSGSGYLTIPSNAVPGPYDVHLFHDEAMQRLSMGDKFYVSGRANVWEGLRPPFHPGWPWGTDIAPSWNAESHTPTDWIALASFGSPDDQYVAWTYTNGAASGTAKLVVPAGLTPGEYELRLFSNNGFERMATAHVDVVRPEVGIAYDWLITDVSPVQPGSQASVLWSGIPSPSSGDYFGMYPLGGTAHVGTFVYTNGAASGSVPFTIPADTKPGRYELRLFPGNGYNRLAATGQHDDIEVSNGIKLANHPGFSSFPFPPESFTPWNDKEACQGGEAKLYWFNHGTATPHDWVGLYRPDAPSHDYLAWTYTNGGEYGSVRLPLPAGLPHGVYELRMYSNNGYQLIGSDSLAL